MTSPDRAQPEGAIGIGQFRSWQLMTEADAKAQMSGGVRTSFNNAQNKFKTSGRSLSEQLAIVNDHTQQIEELRAELGQLTIWGNSRVFTSNNTYYASPGTIRAEVIMLGAGAGGGAGRYDYVLGAGGASGGGGGGENHFVIPGSVLFDSQGNAKAIPIIIGAGGTGAQETRGAGQGGGNTQILDIIVGGGNGGSYAQSTIPPPGGFGMIPGGDGGRTYWIESTGESSSVVHPQTAGGGSVSPYDMHGGGGGGGAGGDKGNNQYSVGTNGGNGGVSPGGRQSSPNGSNPSELLATGGGGGWGQNGNWGGTAGHGGFPAGGGGGGCGGGGPDSWGRGGNGAPGCIWIIEHAS